MEASGAYSSGNSMADLPDEIEFGHVFCGNLDIVLEEGDDIVFDIDTNDYDITIDDFSADIFADDDAGGTASLFATTCIFIASRSPCTYTLDAVPLLNGANSITLLGNAEELVLLTYG